jgi:phosphoglycerate dehydrogenase-like enzyme
MTVIATRHSGTDGPDFVSYVGKAGELPALAAKADVVVNAMPLTPETRNIFNADFFRHMKKDAYFINVGRGESVDQNSLIAALNEGAIAGAALDVVTPEPLPKGHPLWKAHNLVITPHTSSTARDNSDRWVIIREQLRRYAAGEKMLSVVDPKRGY